jgi:hypothetical protein
VVDISKHEDAIFRLIFIVLMRILDYNGWCKKMFSIGIQEGCFIVN